MMEKVLMQLKLFAIKKIRFKPIWVTLFEINPGAELT